MMKEHILINDFKLNKINNIDCVDYDTLSKNIGRLLFSQLDSDNIKNGKSTYVNYRIKDLRKSGRYLFKDKHLVTLTLVNI